MVNGKMAYMSKVSEYCAGQWFKQPLEKAQNLHVSAFK